MHGILLLGIIAKDANIKVAITMMKFLSVGFDKIKDLFLISVVMKKIMTNQVVPKHPGLLKKIEVILIIFQSYFI